jgi:hypothetical protein
MYVGVEKTEEFSMLKQAVHIVTTMGGVTEAAAVSIFMFPTADTIPSPDTDFLDIAGARLDHHKAQSTGRSCRKVSKRPILFVLFKPQTPQFHVNNTCRNSVRTSQETLRLRNKAQPVNAV